MKMVSDLVANFSIPWVNVNSYNSLSKWNEILQANEFFLVQPNYVMKMHIVLIKSFHLSGHAFRFHL